MTDLNKIRNFSIIAHIDHGKSTLADRLLEITNTIEKRKMMAQVLDSMELERERGITIKMQPVRMDYKLDGENYVLNLIDTPGHIDFSYEVSRALKAVEGSILLVDATQGVQAQTLTTLNMARESGLVIIPVVSKIDSPLARVDEVKYEISLLLGVELEDILEVSGKTGEGVENLLKELIKRVPAPKKEIANYDHFRSLVFDFQYDNHRGVIVFVRVLNGEVKKGQPLVFKIADETFTALEVGIFAPDERPAESLIAGEIGYIVTGIKEPGIASVGDTVASPRDNHEPLHGYMSPSPVVWASVYPESQDDLNLLKQSLGRLRLSDSSFTYEEEASGTLGRGYRCGFLGMLHLEIIVERLRREFNLELIVTTPSITYEVLYRNGKKEIIYSPSLFPDDHSVQEVHEPWVKIKIISPSHYLSLLMPSFYEHEAVIGDSENFGDNRSAITVEMPLRELMRNFFDELKSITSGYASISYEMLGMRKADVVRLDILVADEPVVAFARVVSRRRVQEEAEAAVEKLFNVLPNQMFKTKIQGQAMGRILSSRTLSALQKDVTQHMYGGDITRKMKLREKQKKGKKKMKDRGTVNIPQEVFIKMIRSSEN
jgi:GTP-binding protein LepA